jgi:signal transduction histidine kinase/ActR/RegA family two-component response regulator
MTSALRYALALAAAVTAALLPAPGGSSEAPLRFLLVLVPALAAAALAEALQAARRRTREAERELARGRRELAAAEEALAEAERRLLAERGELERHFQAARAASAEAAEASRMKDEFLATVSHELRTPLNAMLGWAQVLQSLVPEGPEKLRHGLATIVRNAKLQAQLIDDLLDVSRIIAGKMRLEMRAVELVPVIESAIEAVRPAADAKRIRLLRHLDPATGAVAGDPGRLQQVVWNLLANAVKFTPPGGQVEVWLTRTATGAEIRVRDSGAGIDPEFLPHVFERFRQVDGSASRKQGGLGLGLAIVRHLVELHGGTVRAESGGIEKGATFLVDLPRADPARDETGEVAVWRPAIGTPPETPLPPDLDGVRVLVVDDEPDAREVIGRILGDCRAEVMAVSSAAEALSALACFKPHVLVSDIGMPEQDGYALIQEVRQLPAESGGTVPAVALTAFARAEDRRRALRAGYQRHAAKPVDIRDLTLMIAGLARGLPAEPPAPN